MDITVTRHANERFRQRFRLKFPKYTSNPHDTESIIIAQVRRARHLTDWKNSPFYLNRVSTQYGADTEIYHKDGVYYVCRKTGNGLVVLTCTHAIICYKKDENRG